MKFAVLSRWTNSVKFEAEIECSEDAPLSMKLRLAVLWAIKTRADLTRADLAGANLTGANLTDANLTDANLTDANLTDADLTRADLTRANLTGANLTGANLTDANLTDANLTDANLTRADLTRADLTRANLTGANLTDANLTRARNDFWDVLLRAQGEVLGLLSALRDGRVDGSTYTGDCACLVGTIANVRHASYDDLGHGLVPNSDRPIERLFMGIRKGDTPATSQLAKIVEGWIVEFQGLTEPASAAA